MWIEFEEEFEHFIEECFELACKGFVGFDGKGR
jgi:hypothetical protein